MTQLEFDSAVSAIKLELQKALMEKENREADARWETNRTICDMKADLADKINRLEREYRCKKMKAMVEIATLRQELYNSRIEETDECQESTIERITKNLVND